VQQPVFPDGNVTAQVRERRAHVCKHHLSP
jgi:hypothetical protein